MELIKRISFSGYSENSPVSWRWLFKLCCSFSSSNESSDHKEPEERRLLLLKGSLENQYQTINLEEAAEWITDSVVPISSIQGSEVGEDSEESDSCDDGAKSQLDHADAKTVAAEEIGKMGESSKYDDDARSDVSDERIQKFATVNATFNFEMMRNLLTIIFHGVDHLPSKVIGGCSGYELAVVIFSESGRKLFKWSSTQFTSTSFKDAQTMEFPEMSPKDISSTAVRIRLYGCERKRRSILLSETTVGLGNVNLKGERYPLKMEKRAELKKLDKRNTESKVSSKSEKVVKTVKITPIKSFFTSKSDTSSILSSSESNSSHIFVTRSNPIKKNPFARGLDEENYTKEMSRNVTIGVDRPVGDQSELLIGLGYNPVTGRLTVEIVKGISFKNPLSRNDDKLPNSFVKVTICAGNNQELTKSKTELRRNQANPLFKEKFMFQVPEFQLSEVTLVFGVYHRKSVSRKEIIGWFSIGLHNSSSAESEQWKSMLVSNGEEVYQWHLLLQNTKTAYGLPGVK